MSRTHKEEQNDHEWELAAWELLSEAKATADLWIQKAKHADEAAADLKAELADTRREWKAETEEQARLLGMSGERECDLRGKLDRERALADRLAKHLEDLLSGCFTPAFYEAALSTWKEARSE